MNIVLHTSYTGAVETVAALLMSEQLASARAQALSIADYSFTADHSSTTPTHSTFRAHISANALPSKLQGFFSRGMAIAISTSLTSAQPLQISNIVRIEGAPVHATVTIELAPTATAQTTGKITAEFSVRVPFIGGKIESDMAKHAEKILTADTHLVNSLLNS